MCRGKALAQDTGVECVNALVCEGLKTVVTRPVSGHCDFVQHLLYLIAVCHKDNLALVNNRAEFVHNHGVQNFSEVAEAQAALKALLAYPDAEQVSLACVHYTLNIVEPRVDFTLNNRLEIRLHFGAGQHLLW